MYSYIFLVVFALCLGTAYSTDFTNGCRMGEWQCEDGQCVPAHNKCDGVVQCADGSDETHVLCRNMRCALNLFQCTYGACVDGTAPCNGVKECADGSDELIPACKNKRLDIDGKFKCANGEEIASVDHCDGVANCADGSDETLSSCAGRSCAPFQFQCAYGACVDGDAACDAYGKHDCVDGSDEGVKLCSPDNVDRPSKICILPEHPKNGRYYQQFNTTPVYPGQMFERVTLRVKCDDTYSTDGRSMMGRSSCIEGDWFKKIPECKRFCRKPLPHHSVEYNCIEKGKNFFSVTERKCEYYEPSGTQINPKCNRGYHQQVSSFMQCNDDNWDNIVTCDKGASCGIPSLGEPMMINGAHSIPGEMPWHAGIFDKSSGTHVQVCGGTLVTEQVVISAAHCFWNDVKKALPPTNYAVGLGEIRRGWNTIGGQYFNVSLLKLEPTFSGATSNYKADIALVFLDRKAEYNSYVRPACIELDDRDENVKQLTPGNIGKVAGWGLTDPDVERPSEHLRVNEIPVIDTEICSNNSDITFREYITPDKFCAGNATDNALCKGDSGGGLVFLGNDNHYYLRGIISTRHQDTHVCNPKGHTTFTSVFHYALFIKEYIK